MYQTSILFTCLLFLMIYKLLMYMRLFCSQSNLQSETHLREHSFKLPGPISDDSNMDTKVVISRG